eukprot:TRINITY_DN11045_c0_g1_i1.p1 TRINITY_DN11045_c0_g1~~TRINITY_DN11045_c0_g1_i1.p1  ORF type:complete len:374 (+),score=11.93 TRINITY_DN11045_c0_g1_i1:94-1215(+)
MKDMSRRPFALRFAAAITAAESSPLIADPSTPNTYPLQTKSKKRAKTTPKESPSIQVESEYDVDYIVGTMPVIISAGHGGDKTNGLEIRDREKGDSPFRTTLINDGRTRLLAKQLAADLSFRDLDGNLHYPHVVLLNLPRSKVDVNRDWETCRRTHSSSCTCVCGGRSDRAVQAWHQFHQSLDRAAEQVQADWATGHLFDIHGINKTWLATHLGYLVPTQTFGCGCDGFSSAIVDQSSVSSLARGKKSKQEVVDILTGPNSLGGLIRDYVCVPSSRIKDPHDGPDNQPSRAGGQIYWRGAYTLTRHTSDNNINGVQIEAAPQTRTNAQAVKLFSSSVSKAIKKYFAAHYRYPLQDQWEREGPGLTVSDFNAVL